MPVHTKIVWECTVVLFYEILILGGKIIYKHNIFVKIINFKLMIIN
jgi:hypothetical protein